MRKISETMIPNIIAIQLNKPLKQRNNRPLGLQKQFLQQKIIMNINLLKCDNLKINLTK